MSDDREADPPSTVLDTLLTPLRLPGRVASNIEELVAAVVALQSDATKHLESVDERAGKIVDGLDELGATIDRVEGMVQRLEQERMQAFLDAVGKLQDSIDRIEGRVIELESLEEEVTTRMDKLGADLNERMAEVREEVGAMRPPIEAMADDVKKIDELLPDSDSGPLTRIKDTLTSSSP